MKGWYGNRERHSLASKGIKSKGIQFKALGNYNYYEQLESFVIEYMEDNQKDFTKYDRETLNGDINEFIFGVRKGGTRLINLEFVNWYTSKKLLDNSLEKYYDKFFYGKDGEIIEIEKDEINNTLKNIIKEVARNNNKPIDEIIVRPDNFYKEELEKFKSLYDTYGRIDYGNEELAKKIYEEMPKIPLSMFISGMCCRQGKVIISPFSDYTFRYTGEEEWDNVLSGKTQTGGFWTSDPTEYAGGDFMFVTEKRPYTYKYQIVQDAPDDKKDLDEILAVYISTGDSKNVNPYKPVYVKDGFDIGKLEYDYNERVEEIHL